MAISIGNNAQLFVSRFLNGSQNNLQTATERLSSGKRVNRASDDAAGLAVAAQLASQLLGTQTAYRNTSDGISLVQTAEGGLSEVSNITQRIRELAIQSSNGTLSDSDRVNLQQEVSGLQQQAAQIFASTEFNGIAVLNEDASLQIQTGPQAGDQLTITTTNLTAQFTANGFFSVDISTANGAQTALSALDASLDTLSRNRANFGAFTNQLDSVGRNLENQVENIAASQSRIIDADYAAEIASQTGALIRQNAGIATLAQSNLSGGLVSLLLK